MEAVPAGGAPKKKLGAIAFVVAAVLVVAIAVTAGLLVRQPWPRLIGAVPKDVEVYVEMPSLRRSLAALKGMAIVDASQIDDKKIADNVVSGLATAFALSVDDAKALAMSLDSAAIAARGIAKEPDVAVLVSFGSASPVEKLIASPRFAAEGTLGKTGKTLKLKTDDGTSSLTKGPFAALRTNDRQTLVWFEKKRLLVYGSAPLVTDIAGVLDGERESFEKSSLYREAKGSLASGAALVVLADTGPLKRLGGPFVAAMLSGFLKSSAPVTATMTPTDLGIRTTVHVRLDGDMMPDEALYASPPSLKLAKRLPSQTLGYFAFSTKLGGTPKSLEEVLKKHAMGGGTGASQRLEETLGVSLTEALGALGEQGVIGVVAPGELSLESFSGLGHVAVVYIVQVKEKLVAQKILTKLQAMQPDAQGKLVGEYLVWATGTKAGIDRAFEAFEHGKDVLGEDAAHAVRTLPSDSQVMMWLDSGRLLGVLARGIGRMGDPMKDATGFSLGAIRATGEHRAMSAAALTMKPAGGGAWDLQLDSLNLEGVGATLAIYGVRKYIASSKTAEARHTLSMIGKDLATYVDNLPEDAPRRFPPSAPQVPESARAIQGKKYMSSPADWASPSWKAIRFSLDSPQYYAYEFETSEDGQSVTIRARGDLNGDGELSLFELRGKIQGSVVNILPGFVETNPEE